jgi:hypothetical protein
LSLQDPAFKAVSYNTALVPVDAGILANLGPAGGWDCFCTVATLMVTGSLRHWRYTVQAHVHLCGATGEDAGPH